MTGMNDFLVLKCVSFYRALDVPLSDYQFEDGTLLVTMRENIVQKFRSILRAKRALG